MKKMLFVLGLSLLAASIVGAACYGPFCYDDTGASVNGLAMNGNGNGVPSLTIAQSSTTIPTAKGQMIYCSNCFGGGNAGTLCVSTATAVDSFVLSTGTHCR